MLHQRRCTDAARLGRAPACEMATCVLESERPRLQSTEDEIVGVARQAAEIRALQAENTLGGEPVGEYVEGVVESLRQRAEQLEAQKAKQEGLVAALEEERSLEDVDGVLLWGDGFGAGHEVCFDLEAERFNSPCALLERRHVAVAWLYQSGRGDLCSTTAGPQ